MTNWRRSKSYTKKLTNNKKIYMFNKYINDKINNNDVGIYWNNIYCN